MSTVRVLVVDDYEPFRRFVCSVLGRKPEFQIVGETGDGLDAVRKAEELQPDLIVLDIGLPTLNGIEAARRIRNLSPKSKILFVSQESFADVVQEALSVGAMGYVIKAFAGNELLSAVGAVLENRQFISSGLSGHHFAAAPDVTLVVCGDQAVLSLCREARKSLVATRLNFILMMQRSCLGFPVLSTPLSKPEERLSWSRPGRIAKAFLRNYRNKGSILLLR